MEISVSSQKKPTKGLSAFNVENQTLQTQRSIFNFRRTMLNKFPVQSSLTHPSKLHFFTAYGK